MHDLFLSYSRKQKDVMIRIKASLRHAGYAIWTDEALTPGTESWKNSIEEAIEETRAVVVLLSPDSKKSEWVKREIDYANIQGKPLIPILVEGTERTAVPFILAGKQYADITHDYSTGIHSLVTTIETMLGDTRVINDELSEEASSADEELLFEDILSTRPNVSPSVQKVARKTIRREQSPLPVPTWLLLLILVAVALFLAGALYPQFTNFMEAMRSGI